MSNKNLRIGQRVSVRGKEGVIRESSDKFKVKFDDGSFGFFAENEITIVIDDSRLKGSKFERLKAESRLKDGATFMSPEHTQRDVFS